MHVVVLPDSPIRDIAQLRGRRVDIGAPSSGTRFDARGGARGHGLKPATSREAREDGRRPPFARLQRKQLDAVFVTSPRPTRALQQLAVQPGLRLLPRGRRRVERLLRGIPA